VVHPVLAGRHALVDAVEALGLGKAGDLVLRGEPTDGWKEKSTHVKASRSPGHGHSARILPDIRCSFIGPTVGRLQDYSSGCTLNSSKDLREIQIKYNNL